MLLAARATSAQRAERVSRIGMLVLGPSASTPPGEAFERRLRELGYIEGRNVTFLRRFADGQPERLPGLAAELVAENPDVVVVAGPGPIRAAKAATNTIPIIMVAGSADPVAEGLVESLARPGGNITGLTYAVSAERFGKQMEILKEALPRLRNLGILWDLDRDLFDRQLAPALNEAGTRLGFRSLRQRKSARRTICPPRSRR
jgi:putative tryptophan/tyrosine transport system substrate-binding protein